MERGVRRVRAPHPEHPGIQGVGRSYFNLPCPTHGRMCTMRWSRRSTGCGPPYQNRLRDVFDLEWVIWDRATF